MSDYRYNANLHRLERADGRTVAQFSPAVKPAECERIVKALAVPVKALKALAVPASTPEPKEKGGEA